MTADKLKPKNVCQCIGHACSCGGANEFDSFFNKLEKTEKAFTQADIDAAIAGERERLVKWIKKTCPQCYKADIIANQIRKGTEPGEV